MTWEWKVEMKHAAVSLLRWTSTVPRYEALKSMVRTGDEAYVITCSQIRVESIKYQHRLYSVTVVSTLKNSCRSLPTAELPRVRLTFQP